MRAYLTPLPFDQSEVVVCPTCGANVHPPCRGCRLARLGQLPRAAPVDDAVISDPWISSPFDPPPDVIAEECRVIRSSWSAAERERRRVGSPERVPWSAPFCQIVPDRELAP